MKLNNFKKTFIGSTLLLSLFVFQANASENKTSDTLKSDVNVSKQNSDIDGYRQIFQFLPFSNLNLNEEQKDKILNIVVGINGNEHFNKQADLRNELNLLIFQDNFLEQENVNQLLDQLMFDYRDFLITEIILENKIYQILNDEQKKTYLSNIKESIESLKSDSTKNQEIKEDKLLSNKELSKDDVKNLIMSK